MSWMLLMKLLVNLSIQMQVFIVIYLKTLVSLYCHKSNLSCFFYRLTNKVDVTFTSCSYLRLTYFTRKQASYIQDIMDALNATACEFVNSNLVKISSWIVAVIIIGLNVYLLWKTFFG